MAVEQAVAARNQNPRRWGVVKPTPDKIIEVLHERIAKFKARYDERPANIPVTLDEWGWLSEWTAYAAALVEGHAPLLNVPRRFQGIPLRLVDKVFERSDGTMVVKP